MHKTLQHLIFVFICLPFISVGQYGLSHTENIKALAKDSLGLLVLIDETDNAYTLDGLRLSHFNNTFLAPIDSLSIKSGQLIRIKGSEYSYIASHDSLLSIFPYQNFHFLGSYNSGLLVYDSLGIRKYNVLGVEFPNRVVSFSANDNKLSLLTESGELYIYDIQNQHIKHVASSVFVHALDRWDVLWHASENRLSQYSQDINNKPPLLSLKAVDQPSKEINPERLELNSNHLELICQAIYSPDPININFSYRLDSNEEWVNNNRDDHIKIKNFNKAGDVLQIKAVSSTGASIISAPIKLKYKGSSFSAYWPILFGALGLLGLLSWVVSRRQNRELLSLRREKEQILLELALSKEKQKIGQLQMNPHFLFNTLNSISGLIALNENTKARNLLNKFSQMMRSVLNHSTEEMISIKEELRFLDHYLSLEQMIHSNKFSYEIINALEEDQLIPPMIIQPIVENAIIHGLLSKDTQDGLVKIKLEERDNQIVAEVIDNGIGRKAASELPKSQHNSMATEKLNQRLKTLNRWQKKGIEYEDLHENGVGIGTKVSVYLPKGK